jgi:hypothetical protein
MKVTVTLHDEYTFLILSRPVPPGIFFTDTISEPRCGHPCSNTRKPLLYTCLIAPCQLKFLVPIRFISYILLR